MPTIDGHILTREELDKIIADFRLFTFRIAYDRLYRTVDDLTLRFAMALVHSVQPIPDEKLPTVVRWHRTTKQNRSRDKHA